VVNPIRLIPEPEELRRRLAVVLHEADLLRRLIRATEQHALKLADLARANDCEEVTRAD
jgi:hypothetical protein